MSSREVAELVEKRHDHVLRDIERMLQEINAPKSGAVDFEAQYQDAKGEWRKEYRLPKDLTVTLITGYRADLRYRVVKRLEDLEAAARQPALPDLSDPVLLTRLLIEHAGARIVTEQRAVAAEAKADAMQADVAAHERLTKADGSLNITDAEKRRPIGRRRSHFSRARSTIRRISSGRVGSGSSLARSASIHASKSGSTRTPTRVAPTRGRPRDFLLTGIVSVMHIC